MSTKNSKATNIIIVSFLVLTIVASVGFYFSRPQTVASASEESISQSASNKPSEKVATPQTNEQKELSVTQNDITVKITSAQVINTGVEIGICYTTLDGGEWYPMPGHLFYSKYEIFPDEFGFLDNEILADGTNTGTRCAFVRYRIDDLNTITTPIKFSILRFYAPSREAYSPCAELQQRLDTNPQAQSYGLKTKCEENADGSTNVTLIGNDKSITVDEAQKALNIIVSAEVSGNWEFTLNDIKR
ncbi:MAG: hypothetical protein JZU49_04435 [Sulfuricurvum sp.]|nr:hypothetical protein [Sulfuricurvum sp.]